MGCCNNEKNNNRSREYPNGVDPCCHVRGKRCLCLPYDDPWMITAQVLSIVAVFLSWVWWVFFLTSIIGMVLLQVIWCCRQNRATVFVSAAVAMINGLASVGLGIFALTVLSTQEYCDVFYMYVGWSDYYDRNHDYCEQKKWAAIAFVCGILWFIVVGLTLFFVTSGRHAKWEERIGNKDGHDKNNKAASDAVELGMVPVAPPLAEPAVATAVALPESGKVDDSNNN